MTPHEERLILELHSKWGNRWSRIARKLPGRTDNEIKNYWRTHMRKKAQERKRATAPPSALSKSSSSTLSSDNPLADSMPITGTKERSFYDTGGLVSKSSSTSLSENPLVDLVPLTETKERSFYDTGGDDHVMFGNKDQEDQVESGKGYNSMDEIWKDIALFEDTVASPLWNYCSPEMFWMMEEEESKMFPTIADPFLACYSNQDSSNSTG